jgi:hypothetical protein
VLAGCSSHLKKRGALLVGAPLFALRAQQPDRESAKDR